MNLIGPKGLGDAIYLRAIALHFLEIGKQVTVFTFWPDVFSDLPVQALTAAGVTGEPGEGTKLKQSFYCLHCQAPAMRVLTQFQMMCLQAGVEVPIELRADWKVRNQGLVDSVIAQAKGRPILLYQPVRRVQKPYDLPPESAEFLKHLDDSYFRVKVGHPNYSDGDGPCERNLFGACSVSDLFDLASVADLCYAEPSYLPILAQALDRRFVCMFSRRALASDFAKVAGVRPERLFHKPHLGTAVYG